MRQLFRDYAQVMIATEAGGEGLNLQFCHHMINYDLPWNPMRVEQRIGRIHRLGQGHEVHITNYAVGNTIEERILRLLYEKIEMFEGVIGHLDDILERSQSTKLEHYVQDALSEDSEVIAQEKLQQLSTYMKKKEVHKVNQAKVHRYIERYLTTSGAQFLSRSPEDIEVQLTRELDEELMNRPFYWHYLDKTGATPQPMQMRMTTNVENSNGFEKVHFGSPRLHQFFSSALNKGRFTRLYEQTAPHSRTALYPWLCLNVRISYTCHRREMNYAHLASNLLTVKR
ncbi:superfamily II DNA/RNA helicase, SNF2 family [Geomicrobium sp. JCM 19055]|nr:superfamily II DNA/RNA helicase, SNF2 family [Geomicrobium sp. JCM 19055]